MSKATAARNLAAAAWNRAGKLIRTYRRRTRRQVKLARESTKHVAAQVRRGGGQGRDAVQQAYSSGVKVTRTWARWRERTWPSVSVELSVRRELRRAARGSQPIILGPWLSEVGYEALYWVPFVRWFVDHYRVDPDRCIAVSRGGVSSWYADVATRYVEILDLVGVDALARAGEARRASGDQKQLGINAFDLEILDRVRQQVGADSHVCHPSTMFRLLRRFWLGTESLQHVLDHTRYRMMPETSAVPGPVMPDSFVAVKLYTGRALPGDALTREAVRALVERVRRGRPVVMLDTGISLDEHSDYALGGLTDVVTLDGWLTPQNNLGIQTEVIRKADLFVGTCGSVAWLAPMLGTDTLALYRDDHLLAPHLYAARQIYPSIAAASFTPVDVGALQALDVAASR